MTEPKVRCAHDRLVPVSERKPHPKNRNEHSKDQIKRLADIINYQGWRYPVKVSKLSGHVTSGHGRIAAAKLKKWKVEGISRLNIIKNIISNQRVS